MPRRRIVGFYKKSGRIRPITSRRRINERGTSRVVKNGKIYNLTVKYYPRIKYDIPRGKKFYTSSFREQGKPAVDRYTTFYQILAPNINKARNEALQRFKGDKK